MLSLWIIRRRSAGRHTVARHIRLCLVSSEFCEILSSSLVPYAVSKIHISFSLIILLLGSCGVQFPRLITAKTPSPRRSTATCAVNICLDAIVNNINGIARGVRRHEGDFFAVRDDNFVMYCIAKGVRPRERGFWKRRFFSIISFICSGSFSTARSSSSRSL